MNEARAEFNKRKEEIDLYFNTLSILDKGRCSIQCKTINEETIEQHVDERLTRILKANGFLLLYNLIESTTRKSIEAIFNAIHSDSITFRQLTLDLKKLWFNQKIIDFKEGTFKIDTLNNMLQEIAEIILNNQLLQFQNECVNISGNIDAREIRSIANKFGFAKVLNGEELLTVKEKRNKLAHGEQTFTEIGKNYSINDLINFKTTTYSYLNEVLSNINDYITGHKYKAV